MASKRRIHTADERKTNTEKLVDEFLNEFCDQFARICKQIEKEHPEYKVIGKCMNKMFTLVDKDKRKEVDVAFTEMVEGLEKYIRKPKD